MSAILSIWLHFAKIATPFPIDLRCGCHRAVHCQHSCDCDSDHLPHGGIGTRAWIVLDTVPVLRSCVLTLVGRTPPPGPRTPRIDSFSIDPKPLVGFLQLADRGGVKAALSTRADGHHEIAAPGCCIDEIVDDPFRTLVFCRMAIIR